MMLDHLYIPPLPLLTPTSAIASVPHSLTMSQHRLYARMVLRRLLNCYTYIFFLSKIKEFCISIIQALSTVLWPGTGILFSWSVDGARYMKKKQVRLLRLAS